ncbi:MAG: SsrA-binding protein SmpB [Clostridia bacterium]|nr:SsrA-binding protein SmpB [Clostridia bacterium]
MKIITKNRVAGFEYFIEDKYEAGIVLEGNEVKSLRLGNVNLNDSFCLVKNGQVTLENAHIALYEKSSAFSVKNTRRSRQLLLHKKEIARIAGKIREKGYTLVPLHMYCKDALVKVEIALCKGKHTYDKKRTLAERDRKRESERAIKEYS